MNRKIVLFILGVFSLFQLGAQIQLPHLEPLNQAAVPERDGYTLFSGTHGRIAIQPGLSETVPTAGTISTLNGANRFRGNVVEVTTDTVLAAHDFYLERDEAQTVRMMVYASDAATGPFSLISDVSVQADIGNSFVSSGDIGLQLTHDRFYLIGAAWLSDNGYTFTGNGVDEPLDFGTMISAYVGNTYLMPETIDLVSNTTNRYRQNLRTSAPVSEAIPDSVNFQPVSASNYFRGQVYLAEEDTFLIHHEFWLNRPAEREVSFMVYEGDTFAGEFSRISNQTVTAPAGEGYVSSGNIALPLKAGKYYIVGAHWAQSTTYRYTANAFALPQAVDFGSASHGKALSGMLPGSTITNNVGTNSSGYWQRMNTLAPGALRMDSNSPGSGAINLLEMELDLQGLANATLSFEHRSFNDAGGFDGVRLFNQANQNLLLQALPGGTTGWQTFEVDLLSQAQSAGWDLSQTVDLVFQQDGSQPWPDGGREFRNIRLDVPPDLRAVALEGPANRLTFRGLSGNKNIPVSFTFETRGGLEDAPAQNHTLRYQIAGVPNFDIPLTSDFIANTVQEQTLEYTLAVPGSTKLTQYSYAMSATLDIQDSIAEADESNNAVQDGFIVNHYSGTLWFGDVPASLFISEWDQRNFFQASTLHRISGTCVLNGRVFTVTDLDVVKNLDTLDYVLDPGLNQSVSIAPLAEQSESFVRYRSSGNIVLNKSGVFADLVVTLPAGFGWASAPERKDLKSTISFQEVSLDAGFAPVEPAVSSAGIAWYAEETKPLMIEADSLTWNPGQGSFSLNTTGNIAYVQAEELEDLEEFFDQGFINAAASIRRSNEQYYRFASIADNETITVSTGTGGQALMTADVDIQPGTFRTHLPYDTNPAWDAKGLVSIVQDLVAGGSTLNDTQNLTLPFDQSCPDGCPKESIDTFTLLQGNGIDFMLSSTGGIIAEGALGVAKPLDWGALSPEPGLPAFAQSAGTMSFAKYLSSGHFIRGSGTIPARPHNGPGFILNTGVNWDNPAILEEPFTPAYFAGLGIYPGINFRQTDHPNLSGQNVLGGKLFGPFALSDRSKYYVRQSGVTGIHEATSFNTVDTIYDYEFAFSNLGFSYLSSAPVPGGSRANGSIDLPYPTNDTIVFERLNIACNGELKDMQPAPGKENLDFSFWAVDFALTQMGFERNGDGCDLGTGTLVVRGATGIEFIPSPMYGTLALSPAGRILPITQNDLNIDSRFDVPSVVDVNGTSEQIYTFLPSHQAYLNDYDSSEAANQDPNEGYFSLAGRLGIPFFEAMKVQFHFGTGNGVLHLAGGWPTHGWRGDDDSDFFNKARFDPGHTARPPGVTLDNYRSNTLAEYRPRAIRHIEGITHVDYPMAWSDTSRTFTSANAIGREWLTMSVESQVDYLDAENAEISFGIQYDGLPRLNLANFVFDKVDEHLGIAQSAINSGVDVIMGEVNKGLKGLDKILKPVSGNLTEFLIKDYVDPILGQLYDDMAAEYENAEDLWIIYDNFILGRFVGHNPGDAYEITLTQRFEYFFSGFGEQAGFIDSLIEELDNAIASVNALTPSFPYLDEHGVQQQIRGMLAQDPDGNFDLLEVFAVEMISFIGADLASAILDEIDDDIRSAINEATRPIFAVLEVLEGVREELTLIKEALEQEVDFYAELQALIVLEGEDVDTMGDIATRAGNRMIAYLRSLPPDRNPFADMTREEFVDIMREEIRIEFFASDFHEKVVSTLRARVYNIEGRYRKGVDTLFSQVNKAIRDALSEVLSEIDDEINGMAGDLEEYLGAGQIDGYAHIRGDDLERVRLDGAFQWKVPDELEFKGFLEIEKIPETGNAMCDVIGMGPARKVTIGALELPCGWMGNDIRVNILTHFSFARPDNLMFPVPIGLGGQFALSENSAPISFEAFEIYSLGAGVAFGATEGYIAAQAGLRFNNAEVAGGMFFGATCNIEPLLMVDPEVGSLLGEPPLIGGYVYGEGWIPVLEYGCALNVSAGVGAGIFFFSDTDNPPTFGLKLLLGVKGQAICAVTVRGEVRMLGMKRAGKFYANGSAKLVGELGYCDFCVRHVIKVNVTYDDGDLQVKY